MARTQDALFTDPRWDTFGLFREAYLALDGRIEGDLARAGAPERSVTDLIFRLARTPGRALRPGVITKALSTTSTRTTRIIDEAEGVGLVERRADPTDRRGVQVALTDAGLQAARTYGQVALESAQRHLHDRLTANQTKTLEGLLRKLRD